MTARPSVTASVLAVAAAAAVPLLLGVSPSPILAVEIAGLALLAGGLSVRRRGWSWTGTGVAFVGSGCCALSIGLTAVRSSGLSELLWTVPGVAGVALVGLAVAPLRGSGTRWLVKAGAGGLFLAVGVAGLFRTVPLGTLLVATAATVLAWDAGEHAIDVGRQLGRSASTWRLDIAHLGATAVVGAVGVLVGHVVGGMQAGRLSLSAFAVLCLALVGLTLALHR